MSLKGKMKLIHNGFEFVKQRDGSRGITHWVCAKCRRYHCRGKAKTCQIGQKQMVKFVDQHNHMSNDFQPETTNNFEKHKNCYFDKFTQN